MNDQIFEHTFTELLAAWLSHQKLRSSDVPIRDLAESRFRLDATRDRCLTARRELR